MAFIEIFDGSFPAQSAMLLKKSAFTEHATLALKGIDKKHVYYNVRNAIQSVEIITPNDKKPGIKIVLKDDKVIVARTDRKTIEDIRLIIAAGPDEDGGLYVAQPEKKKKAKKSLYPVLAKMGRFIAWTSAVFLGVIGFASCATGYWYVGIVLMFMAVAIVPPVLPKVPVFKKKSPVAKTVSLVLLGIIVLIIGGIFSPPDLRERQTAQVVTQTPEAEPEPTPQVKAEKPKKKHKAPTQSDAQVMAATLCEMRVKDGLKAPRTAKFPWVKEVSFNGKTATLVSYVDAENGFGAMIRTHYTCTVDYPGGKPSDLSSWQLTDVVMLD